MRSTGLETREIEMNEKYEAMEMAEVTEPGASSELDTVVVEAMKKMP